MSNDKVVLRFEEEFKNKANIDIVDEIFAPDVVCHLPYPGMPDGSEAVKAIGRMVFGAIGDITVTVDLTVDLTVGEGDLVADRVSARGVRKADNQQVSWTENHFYRLKDGRIVEWWPEGSPPLQP